MSPREWTDIGTKLFLDAVDKLTDDEFDVATALPGWTRKHVVAHVHYNAEALRRLLSWARTGVENRMYASAEQRNAEIASGTELPATDLRALVHDSAVALTSDMDTLSAYSWQREVVTAQGRTVPATEVPWLRAREVCVHAVDLGCGVSFEDLPEDFTAALITDAAAKHRSAALAAWLTGRAAEAPTLGRWL
ncbi:MAG: maleylpyruvate isomerase family mycothiol-dependent enzyme [Actinophytocola sp.]|nr:maleylpyruvate isomerase family mycothiol-dependent enzyme [Actinophytocola sp.]